MPNPSREPTKLAALRLKYRGRFDAVMMLVYLFIVYVWALWAYPLGRDYAVLADPTGSVPGVSGHFVSFLVTAFGSSIISYHLLNLALLYTCMLCIYRMANSAIGGPWWLGTLAASLFMANPVHTESVLNLTGSVDLLPSLAALLFMAAHTSNVAKPDTKRMVLSLTLFAGAVALFQQNCGLVFVVLLYEWTVVPAARRNLKRTLVIGFLGALGLVWHAGPLAQHLSLLPGRLASLYFLFYPIGYLPRTVDFFTSHPWSEWAVAALVVFLLALVYRGSRRPAILFGLLAMVAVRIAPDQCAIDPVHLIGGGQLLTANAFYALALVALFYRIMEHRKWKFPMVTLTTAFAAAFFVIQASANLDWHRAGKTVAAFQKAAERFSAEHPDTPVCVVPDWQMVGWAPMYVSHSIRHATPFSKPLSHISLLRISQPEQNAYGLSIGESSASRLHLTFTTSHNEGFSHMGSLDTAEGFATSASDVEVRNDNGREVKTMRVEIRAEGGEMPQVILPGE